MRRFRPPNVLLQVAMLAVAAVVATQLATLAIVALAPGPPPAGYSLAAASAALRGQVSTTRDGRILRRHIVDGAPFGQENDPLAHALAHALAAALERDANAVRVQMDRSQRPFDLKRGRRPERADSPLAGPRAGPPIGWRNTVQVDGLADQVSFPPFSAAVRLQDGRWS